MKYNKILPAIALSCILFASCDDNLMEWGKDPSHGDIASSELPLELAEKISRYEPLKTYTDFKLGAGIGLDEYMNDAAYRTLVNENFDEVTVGYAMKHAPMVSSTGAINFTKVDAFIAKTKEAGLSVFGHTLVWHSNQNASYLNSLIAPTIIPGSSGPNTLNIAGLKDGTFSSWAKNNPGAGITAVDGAGLSSTSKAIKLVSSATSSQAYNLQLTSPSIPAVSGHRYEISFFIKSDQAGKGRISFDSNVTNQYPYQDWYAAGATYTEAFVTTSLWKQVKFVIKDIKAASTAFKFNFDLGYLPNVTYYIDASTVAVVDLDAAPTVTNLVANGNFNTDISGWSKWNGDANALNLGTAAEAYEGNGVMKVINSTSNPGSQYKTQIHSNFTSKLKAGTAYTVSYYIKSDAAGSVRCSTTGNAMYQGDQNTSTAWKYVEWKITGTGAEDGFNFDLGAVAGTYYIDKVVVTDGVASGGGAGTPSVTIEKTDAEKATLIGNAMTDWISKMVSHYKNDVKAWDVVNEPMKEGGSLRDGVVTDLASDEFYWVKYLGKDYAVTAFKLARQYGNATDKLFINDYNLEANLPKCDGLIDYVKYIESQGAAVDGIGTQMHISLTTDKAKIVEMFKKMAASGKLIKISELDVRLGTASPTLEQLASQSAMYQYVIDSYRQYIPKAQQYGITIWGISDRKEEHVNWLPNESPNLWDASYKRKHAYKGVADGLAGKDVSAGFSGDLVKK
ncbi:MULTISPECIES: endo-1,4-beta-xylanase [Flavobacterium]|uniref:endo-1,4-beta-xylanase n=1 Tax=Flavobacterium TaxID=237 RepID=UPI00188A0A69|nr:MULTISPECIES: endo-1,4-beta-xylanase [Flavobacterium]MBF4470463.1 endo-1,4-beta-xylanase [Flavobacterium sp. HJJ]